MFLRVFVKQKCFSYANHTDILIDYAYFVLQKKSIKMLGTYCGEFQSKDAFNF